MTMNLCTGCGIDLSPETHPLQQCPCGEWRCSVCLLDSARHQQHRADDLQNKLDEMHRPRAWAPKEWADFLGVRPEHVVRVDHNYRLHVQRDRFDVRISLQYRTPDGWETRQGVNLAFDAVEPLIAALRQCVVTVLQGGK